VSALRPADALQARLDALTAEEVERALAVFRENLDHEAAAQLQSCVHCGLCAGTCHYALTHGEPADHPAHKLNLVAAVFRYHFTLPGRLAPGVVGARPLDARMLEEWVDALWGRCSLCGRCHLHCSIGIHTPQMVRAARAAMTAVGLIPPELRSTIDKALETGNNMGIAEGDWTETVEWLTEELRTETGDPAAELPLDRAGAHCLYAVNPREPKFFPLSLVAAGKIFHAAGESWTFSRRFFDVTNYGYFSGVDGEAEAITRHIADDMARLGCSTLVLGECGHGFASFRWEGPRWLRERYGFEVVSVLELVDRYLREGRIALDPARNPKRVTLHDPCNLTRYGGVVEPQRRILRAAAGEFVEMAPHGADNFCCGGGGGQLAMSRFAPRRLEAARVKADQIRATGAAVVATPCHNCIDQLAELNKEYKLGVEVRSVCEIVADALVVPGTPHGGA
jgi:Fe-S oxidoreductase